MRKTIYTLTTLIVMLTTIACNDYETYGELKERERDAIEKFISDSSFVIISEDQFHNQGDKTLGNKQFVILDKSGVYMQILNIGSGETIKDGETMNILCRFSEKAILDTTSINNLTGTYVFTPDIMCVTRRGADVFIECCVEESRLVADEKGRRRCTARNSARKTTGWL